MAAGTAYAKRYASGFTDLDGSKPVDAAFLNAVETALLQLIGAAPSADGQVAQWDNANTRFGPALILNKNIDAAAAIAKSKLDFTGANGIVNADIAGAAAIAPSKIANGISAAQISGGIGMQLICDSLLGASQASFDTNTILGGNIPSTFKHLRLVASLRTDQAAAQETPLIRFNNDSGAVYDYVATQSQSATETSSHAENQTSGWAGAIPGATTTAGWFGPLVVDIADYLSTVAHKTWIATGGVLVGGAGSNLRTIIGLYHPAAVAAITRIQIIPQIGPNFVTGSRFSLYGIA